MKTEELLEGGPGKSARLTVIRDVGNRERAKVLWSVSGKKLDAEETGRITHALTAIVSGIYELNEEEFNLSVSPTGGSCGPIPAARTEQMLVMLRLHLKDNLD